MKLIDSHGLFEDCVVVASGLVVAVAPGVVVQIIDDGGVVGTLFGIEGIGIAFIASDAVGTGDDIAVGIALDDAGHKAFPDAAVPGGTVHPLFVFPAGFGGDDRNILGVGRPYVKQGAFDAVSFHRMSAEFFVSLIVCSLMKQVAVHIGKKGIV